MPEPATRSRTVLVTSTSPGAAADETRAPMCTAIPATSTKRTVVRIRSSSAPCSRAPVTGPVEDEHDVARTVADRLIGEVHVAALRVERPRRWHFAVRITAAADGLDRDAGQLLDRGQAGCDLRDAVVPEGPHPVLHRGPLDVLPACLRHCERLDLLRHRQ